MAIRNSIRVYPEAFDVPVNFWVVAYLADASGRIITADTIGNATYIKTELFDCDDDALNAYDAATEAAGGEPQFLSIHDQRGESLV